MTMSYFPAENILFRLEDVKAIRVRWVNGTHKDQYVVHFYLIFI